MSALTERIAREHAVAWIEGGGTAEVFACLCGHRSTNTDSDDPFSAVHNLHVAEVLEAEVLRPIREALATHPRACEATEEPISCGWKRAVLDVQAALETQEPRP